MVGQEGCDYHLLFLARPFKDLGAVPEDRLYIGNNICRVPMESFLREILQEAGLPWWGSG